MAALPAAQFFFLGDTLTSSNIDQCGGVCEFEVTSEAEGHLGQDKESRRLTDRQP